MHATFVLLLPGSSLHAHLHKEWVQTVRGGGQRGPWHVPMSSLEGTILHQVVLPTDPAPGHISDAV